MEKHCGGLVGVPASKSTVALGVTQDISRQRRIRVGRVDRENRCGFWLHIPSFENAELQKGDLISEC